MKSQGVATESGDDDDAQQGRNNLGLAGTHIGLKTSIVVLEDPPRCKSRIDLESSTYVWRSHTNVKPCATCFALSPLCMETCSFKEVYILQWQEAMKEEYDFIMRNDTWHLVDRPKKRKVISTKWIYKLKLKSDVLELMY